MNTFLTFLAGTGLILLAFKAGQNWERGKPTPGERQETLSRHVEPTQRLQDTEPIPAWFSQWGQLKEELDTLGKEG